MVSCGSSSCTGLLTHEVMSAVGTAATTAAPTSEAMNCPRVRVTLAGCACPSGPSEGLRAWRADGRLADAGAGPPAGPAEAPALSAETGCMTPETLACAGVMGRMAPEALACAEATGRMVPEA